MKIAYRISEQDYMNAHDLFVANEKPLYRRFSRRLMPWLGAFVLALQAFFLIVEPHRDLVLVVVGCLVGLLLLYLGFALRRYFRRAYQKDHRYKHDFTAEISDEGIHVVTPFSDSQLKWNSFVRFLESANIFMVFVAEWNFIVFPKRAFAPGEADQFRALLQHNIAPPN
ncbi:MAG: YcxB family protein [Acidobacteriia bacterium]|nr:YcxB family protein [Terriglobia bacterium]